MTLLQIKQGLLKDELSKAKAMKEAGSREIEIKDTLWEYFDDPLKKTTSSNKEGKARLEKELKELLQFEERLELMITSDAIQEKQNSRKTALEIRKEVLRGEMSKEQGLGELRAMELEINTILQKTKSRWPYIELYYDFRIGNYNSPNVLKEMHDRSAEIDSELRAHLKEWTPDEALQIIRARRDLEIELDEEKNLIYTPKEIIRNLCRGEFTKTRAMGEVNYAIIQMDESIKTLKKRLTDENTFIGLNDEEKKAEIDDINEDIQDYTKELNDWLEFGKDVYSWRDYSKDQQNTGIQEEPIEPTATAASPEPPKANIAQITLGIDGGHLKDNGDGTFTVMTSLYSYLHDLKTKKLPMKYTMFIQALVKKDRKPYTKKTLVREIQKWKDPK